MQISDYSQNLKCLNSILHKGALKERARFLTVRETPREINSTIQFSPDKTQVRKINGF